MPKVEQPGRYIGRVMAQTPELSKGGCIQIVAACEVLKIRRRGEPDQVLADPQHITAYLNISTLAGAVNQNQVDNLVRALGWDGKDLKALRDADYSAREVEVVVEDDEGRLRVAWINPIAGIRKAADSDIAAMQAKWDGIRGAQPAAEKTEGVPF